MAGTRTVRCDQCDQKSAILGTTDLVKEATLTVRCATLACLHQMHVTIRVLRVMPQEIWRATWTPCSCTAEAPSVARA
jgi:hypothetical protein